MRQAADNQSRESGGVLGFIIITLVLIGLLAGGLWFIKNRYDVAAKVDTVSQNVKDEANKATDTKDDSTEQKKPDASAGTSTNNGTNPGTGATNTPSQTQTPAPTPNTTQNNTPAASTPAPQPASVATTGPSHIASTGPEDVVVNGFLLAGLLIVGHLYRQSRRHAA
jgi:cytoskeletal protein RodZ